MISIIHLLLVKKTTYQLKACKNMYSSSTLRFHEYANDQRDQGNTVDDLLFYGNVFSGKKFKEKEICFK